jgi:uncharacterized protein
MSLESASKDIHAQAAGQSGFSALLALRWLGHDLRLHPSGAVFLPRHGLVLVADAHFGKALSFRRLGVPVPQGTTQATLDKLDALLAQTQASGVVFLGDFLHSAHVQQAAHASHGSAEKSSRNETLSALAAWRERNPDIRLTLVRGNHDSRAGDPPADLRFQVVDEPWVLPSQALPGESGSLPLALCHHPQPLANAAVLAGHWHPCTVLRGRAHERLRLPCFWLTAASAGNGLGILPAFGSFTGMHPIARQSGDRLFAVAGQSVRELP